MEATATPRAQFFRDNTRQRQRAVNAEACPPKLKHTIETQTKQLAVLAIAGLWTEAERVFRQLRELALAEQAKTVDPFDVLLSDTTLAPEILGCLQHLCVSNVGQLAHVPRDDFRRHSIGPARYARVKQVAASYGVRLRDD